MTAKKISTVTASPITASAPPATSSIVSRVERKDPFGGSAKGLGGEYRIIHGSVLVPRPEHEWKSNQLANDGTLVYAPDGRPRTEVAIAGDVVRLTDEDAKRMLDSDLVEPLDAKPSRVGKVWDPPKPVRNKNTGGSGVAA